MSTMTRLQTATALAFLVGAIDATAGAPRVSVEYWINELLPDDLRTFEAIQLPTKSITVGITRPGTTTVRRQRVDVKGDYEVVQVTELLQAILGEDDRYWNSRAPVVVGVIGDSRRTMVNTSWGNGAQEGDTSHVYTLEEGKWRYLYQCCRKTD